MENAHPQVEWRALVGRFGEPIPKLKRDEKVHLKALLKDPKSRNLDYRFNRLRAREKS